MLEWFCTVRKETEEGVSIMRRLNRLIIFSGVLLMLALAAGVSASAAGITVKRLTLTQGTTYKLKVKGVKGKVKWTSSNKKIAKVTKKGKVKGIKPGNVTITAKVGKKKYKCAVTVQKKKTKTVAVKKTTQSGSIKTVREGKTSTLTEDTLGAGLDDEELQVLKKLLSFKSKYPEGKGFTNADYFGSPNWTGGIYRGGYGCAAFAFELSEAAFPNKRGRMHYNWDQIRVGDILRTDSNTHSVIVLRANHSGSSVTNCIVAEANYNKSVHWGRKVTKKELTNVITRYDTATLSAAEAAAEALWLPRLYDFAIYPLAR